MNDETPEPDVRQVMVGSFLDHPTATLPGLIEFGSHVPDDVTDALAIVDRLLADERLHVALSAPPADDVREALAFRFFAHESGQDEEFVRRVWVGHPDGHPVKRSYFGQADALLADAALEVRPRETVTDAEVDAAGRALYGISWGDEALSDPNLVRTALEAAREARL